MDYFNYRENQLFAENVPLARIAHEVDTPCYVYSKATLVRHYRALEKVFAKHPHQLCYAVKANSNLAILQLFARLGAWFDIVSVGELERVLQAGGHAQCIVFSGVGKRDEEIKRALILGIACFNVESPNELQRINKLAQSLGLIAPIALRINPNINPKTHPYIATGLAENKFGIPASDALAIVNQLAAMPSVKLIGIACHIGSQLLELTPFTEAASALLQLAQDIQALGFHLKHLDLGGGLGVRYQNEVPPSVEAYADALLAPLQGSQLPIFIEPGRVLVANAGILLSRIICIKQHQAHRFAIVDAAMNDLLRPALYHAWQEIIPVQLHANLTQHNYHIVGPVCETGDFLGKDRMLALQENDLLAVRTAGAYGFVMSSNYNSRPRAAEVMVDGDQYHIIRKRETIVDLYAHEQLLPEYA